MRKALVNLAIGEKYASLQQITGPFRQAWADRHGWEYRPIGDAPEWLLKQHGSRGIKFALDLYKLYLASEMSDFDLVIYSDSDTFMNPSAPCLSTYFDQIPKGGFAAVNDVPYEKRAKFFPEWDEDYYVEVERRLGTSLTIPDRTQHMNGGFIVFKPKEVAERWRELADMDSPLHDEQRLSLYELQAGKCLFLPIEWNLIWQYYVREHYPYLRRPLRHNKILHRANTLIARTLARPIERRHLLLTLSQSHMVHVANQNSKIPLLRGIGPGDIERLSKGRLWRSRLYV